MDNCKTNLMYYCKNNLMDYCKTNLMDYCKTDLYLGSPLPAITWTVDNEIVDTSFEVEEREGGRVYLYSVYST